MDFPFGETVILHRHTGSTRNSLGQIIDSYTDIEIHNAAVFTGTSREVSNSDGVKVDSGMSFVTDEDFLITYKDKATVRGTKYDVDGNTSGVRRNPWTGDSFGTKVSLRRITGG